MSRWFYMNGEFVTEDKAVLPVTQTGMQRAYGIFDLFRTENGKPRFMQDYLDRFKRSQQFLNLNRSINREEVQTAVAELQSRNQYKDSKFKLVLMGDGPDEDDTHFEPCFYIVNTAIDPSTRPKAIGVISHEYLREFPEVKSLNYLNSYSLHRKRIAAKAKEVIYHLDGQVSEASRSNVFAIKDGILFTPATQILHGITRMHVLKVAAEVMPVKVGPLSLDTLLTADEIFITSTIKDVMPIQFVDDKAWKTPGPYTQRIQKVFREYVSDSD